MEDNYTEIIKELGIQKVKINEPLSKYSTIKIGGPADILYEITSESDLVKIISACKEKNIPFIIIGWGSNILFSDKGFKGVVIKNKINKINLLAIKGKIKADKKKIDDVLVEIASGTSISQVVRFTIEESLSGFEYFLGLPGTIGGAIIGNSHNMRWNKFIGDLVIQGKILSNSGKIEVVDKRYFKKINDKTVTDKNYPILLSAIFSLKSDNKENLWKIATDESSYRQKNQPNQPSLGCTFKNITKSQAFKLATPKYTTSSGYLIDQCGLKGFSIGGVEISKIHANFIINKGNATASDMIQLINICKNKVKEKFGISLIEEIKLIGEF